MDPSTCSFPPPQASSPSKRNKSIIRSSSSGSYPYPRTHTTLMVIPSNRPPPPPQPVKMFTGVRRRPPLNRACPPIPESKSNESIMSHASRVSEHQKAVASDTTTDLVIENRNVVDVLHRLDSNSNIARNPKEKKAKMSSTPRSPLMSMANSVKSKLTKITHLGRSSEPSSSSSIKTSQSFSGIRQPKQVPKRIDQNANRVIKSSSMEVPSTSKVCIPQDPTPLVDDKVEEVSEAGLISRSEMAPPKPMQHLCIKLEEDVLVVTKEFDERYPGQKRSASPDPPLGEESQTITQVEQLPSVMETESDELSEQKLDSNANQKTPGPTRRVIEVTTTTVTTTTSCDVPSLPTEITEAIEEQESVEEDVIAAEVGGSAATTAVSIPIPEDANRSKKERVVSPERYVLLVKTPEALRKHRTLTIGEKDPSVVPPQLEEQIQYNKLETVRFKEIKEKVKPEEPVPKEKFILTVKTPETLRRHHTFTIRDKSPEEMKITKSQSDAHVSKKLQKQASEPERNTVEKKAWKETEKGDVVPQPKFVMVMKTPECLRRHHTFTVGDRSKSPDYPYIEEGEVTEPIATVGPPADRRKKEEEKERKRKEWEEYEKPKEKKFILTTTTPLAIRKYQTFVVEAKEEKPLPQSMSADAVMTAKKGKIQRSESTDSKKHSYLRRLQLELFRGRSRERKSEKQGKRQKSLDERKPESAQKYILSTTTPIMMRKYQTFAIVDGKSKEPQTNMDSIESAYKRDHSFDEEHTTSPVRTSDFYSITATTPVAKRKVIVEESFASSAQLSFEEPVGSPSQKPISPEPRHLFVMGGRRSTTPKEERRADKQEPPKNLKLDTTDRSQSDKAELLEERKSTMSGDLTSPEEEIPMDINLTPTTEDVMEAVIISRRIEGLMTSPIEEEPEGVTSSIRDLSINSSEKKRDSDSERPAPVFTPPSPPKEKPFPVMTVPKSTSTSSADSAAAMTSSTSSSRATKPTQLPIKKTLQVVDPMHIVELKPEHKSKKEALASKSLRNAGKMLTPSFLRKDKKGPKKSLYAKTTSTGRQHISEKLEREKKAPLAEGESSVVANSPLVENLPITFEKWSNKSPRLSVKHFSETIIEEGLDANANAVSPQLEHRVISTSHAVQDNTGLIDDDILDQPMLVGDTFSHSSSIDCLSAHQKMNESIISIDRSLVQPDSRSSARGTQNQNNANRNTYIESSLDRQIDAGRSEVQDIKSQLQKLNRLVNEMGVSGWEEELTRLRRENEQLRRELAERDATIAALQSQTVSS